MSEREPNNIHTSPHTRRYAIRGVVESAVGGLTMVAGMAYAAGNPGLPGEGLVARAVKLVDFMPQPATRAVLAGIMAAGSAVLIAHGVRSDSRENGNS